MTKRKRITRNPPMTAKKLREFVKAYIPAFPGWRLVNNEYFIRCEGPIAQVVGFEALRMGAYRPMNAIRILVAPDAGMLDQFLDVKNREVLATEHDENKIRQLVEAMEKQFIPAIRSALVPDEVLRLWRRFRPTVLWVTAATIERLRYYRRIFNGE